jgi:hypothetical protein
MIQRPYKNTDDQIMCIKCGQNKSSKAKYIEEKLIGHLESILSEYSASGMEVKKESAILKSMKKQLNLIEGEISDSQNQKSNLHDFLEKGIYSVETFLDRENILTERIYEQQEKIKKLKSEIKVEESLMNGKINIVPQIRTALNLYRKSESAELKNKLLKEIIDYVEYKKEKHQRNDDFLIIVHTIDNP